MQNKIYMHAIYTYDIYNSKETIKILNQILDSGNLLSLRLQNKPTTNGFNGIDYISLCDYEKKDLFHEENPNYNAYQNYIRNSLALIFPKENINAISPTIIPISTKDIHGYKNMSELGENKLQRYSDMYDEVQVKDSIPISLLSGITFPTRLMVKTLYTNRKIIENTIEELEKIKTIITDYGIKVPIYDVDTELELDNPVIVKKLIKKYRG